LDSLFSYSGRSVARQQLLATSLRLDNRAPLGAGYFCAPGLVLAKSGFGGLNNTNTWLLSLHALPSAIRPSSLSAAALSFPVALSISLSKRRATFWEKLV
jgi:hypothetical protein